MKKMIMLTIATTILSINLLAQDQEAIEWIKFESIEEALNFSDSVSKPLFIYFTAAWCQPCKKAEQEYFSCGAENELNRTSFVNLKIDVDKDTSLYNQAINKFNYQGNFSMPTFQLIFTKDDYRHRFSGYSSVAEFKSAMAFPSIMLAYKKSRDKAALLKELAKEDVLKQYLEMCANEYTESNSLLLLDNLQKILNVDNAGKVLSSISFQRFFSKKSYLVGKNDYNRIYGVFRQFVSRLEIELYESYLARFYPDENLYIRWLAEFVVKPEGDLILAAKRKASYGKLLLWLKQAVFTHNYFTENEILRIGEQFSDRKLIERLIEESELMLVQEKGDDSLFIKAFIEYFDTYNTGPYSLIDGSSGPKNLNYFAWYHVFLNSTVDSELLQVGLRASARCLELYIRDSVENRSTDEFENYVDTYFNLFKRITTDNRIDKIYAASMLTKHERVLFPLLNESYLNCYEKVKVRVLETAK